MKITVYQVTEQSVSPEGYRYCTSPAVSYPTLELARAAFAAEPGAAELKVKTLHFNRDDFCRALEGNCECAIAGVLTKRIDRK